MAALLPQNWHLAVPGPKDGGGYGRAQQCFLCSTDPALIQPEALNRALASDLLWWASPLGTDEMASMLTSCVCLGLYDQSGCAADGNDGCRNGKNGVPGPPMVGFARLITDRVTFAYLSDVYVLPAYQHRGLGSFVLRCLRELLLGSAATATAAARPSWKHLRSLWLVASTPSAARMYMSVLGAEEVARYRPTPGVAGSGMIHLEMPGPANGLKQRQHAPRERGGRGQRGGKVKQGQV